MKKIFVPILLLLIPLLGFSQEKKVCISSIENKIQIGQMLGNRNLTFGFKNVLLEYLQDREFELVDSCNIAENKLQIELIFFDVLNTKTGFSVIHKENVLDCRDEETCPRRTLHPFSLLSSTFPSPLSISHLTSVGASSAVITGNPAGFAALSVSHHKVHLPSPLRPGMRRLECRSSSSCSIWIPCCACSAYQRLQG